MKEDEQYHRWEKEAIRSFLCQASRTELYIDQAQEKLLSWLISTSD